MNITLIKPQEINFKEKDIADFFSDNSKLEYHNEYSYPENKLSICIGIQKYNDGDFIICGASMKLHSTEVEKISFSNIQIKNAKEFMFLMERSNLLSKMKNPDLVHG